MTERPASPGAASSPRHRTPRLPPSAGLPHLNVDQIIAPSSQRISVLTTDFQSPRDIVFMLVVGREHGQACVFDILWLTELCALRTLRDEDSHKPIGGSFLFAKAIPVDPRVVRHHNAPARRAVKHAKPGPLQHHLRQIPTSTVHMFNSRGMAQFSSEVGSLLSLSLSLSLSLYLSDLIQPMRIYAVVTTPCYTLSC